MSDKEMCLSDNRPKSNDDGDKLVVPDGGWGYVVAGSFVTIMTLALLPASLFSLIFEAFLVETHAQSSDVGLINGFGMLVTSLTAFLTSIPLKKFSYRQVGIFGALTYSIGSFAQIFINSIPSLLLCNGLIIPCGTGMLLSTAIPSVSSYFEKKRGFVMCICQVIVGGLSVVGPTLYQQSLTYLGFRGTLKLIFTQSLLIIFATMLLRPVEQYMKMEKVSKIEYEINRDLAPLHVKLNTNEKEKAVERRSIFQRVFEFMGLDIFKNCEFINICIGSGTAVSSDMSYTIFLPLHLYAINWKKDDVALLLSLLAGGDLLGRIGLVLIMKFFTVESKFIFLSGVVTGSVLKIAIPHISSVNPLLALSVLLGITKACMACVQPLLAAEAVPTERFAAANGLQLLFVGLIAVAISPFIGLLKDVTDSYIWSFNALTLLNLVCIVPWTIQFCLTKSKRGKHLQALTEEL